MSFIDPATLSLAAPPSPSPSSSSYLDHDDIDPTHESGPSRKRPRTAGSVTSEDRKEARAHRNRIAAQNSRDRRKAQFTYLERRVTELEEENRRLRAGAAIIPSPTQAPAPVFAAPISILSVDQDRLRAEREKERERENEELKERIRTLEKGWDAVVKALAAQGLPTGAPVSAAPQPIPSSTPSQPPSTIKPSYTAFPSPAPSHSSLDFDSSPSSSPSTGGDHRAFTGADVPAAGGLVNSGNAFPSSSDAVLAGAASQTTAATVEDDKAMEDLFREILASPRATHASLLPLAGGPATQVSSSASVEGGVVVVGGKQEEEEEEKEITIGATPSGAEQQDVDANTTTIATADNSAVVDWANEIEMQRILDTMMMMSSGSEMDLGIGMEYTSPELGLELELGMGDEFGMDFTTAAGTGAGQAWDMGVF
ncbi:hypothetical protein B0H34DRAFT_802485 [Crassisporium funariophilum]|nr:hypothetical protein B0H34DRAFT_802485 [Crassisporium funariophilum]